MGGEVLEFLHEWAGRLEKTHIDEEARAKVAAQDDESKNHAERIPLVDGVPWEPYQLTFTDTIRSRSTTPALVHRSVV